MRYHAESEWRLSEEEIGSDGVLIALMAGFCLLFLADDAS